MLATQITNHIQAALQRQMYEYQSLPAQYLMLLNSVPPYVPPGTYTPFYTENPDTTIGFGYGALVGLAQAFQVTNNLSIGQITANFQSSGAVSDGLITAYLYVDDGTSPSIYATPTGGPIMRAVEVYSATDIASEWVNQGSTGYVSKTFTFDFEFAPGYYWIVFSSNFPGSLGNSLLLGLSSTGGLALANGYNGGQNVSGLFGPNSASGTAQLALTIAEKTSAPPLQPSNSVEVSGLGVLLASVVDQIQILENAIYSINEGRQLYNGTTYPAVGAQLDGLGQIVGVKRNGLSDELYLVFILGTIGENYSNTTIPEIATLIGLLFQTSTFGLFPLYPAEIDVQIPESAGLPQALFPQAINIVTKAVGAGIGIGFASVYPANAFAFSSLGGPSVGGGFGDLNDPSVGGGFASLFYNNPGA